MKYKFIFLIIMFFEITFLSFSQETYNIAQIKDTLIKYPNVFVAFSKLDIDKIPVEAFKQDTFLMSKSYELFEKKYSFELSFRHYKFDNLKYLYSVEQDKKNYIEDYLKKTRNYSNKKNNQFLDSIFKNNDLFKIYLDSAVKYQFDIDSIDIFNYDKWQTDSKYIFFHSKLMTQRSYDTIRAYYDRFYKNSLDFTNPVLIALINMGDPEIRAKYDSIFNQKVNTKSFEYRDLCVLLDLRKFCYIKGYIYNKLKELIFLDYLITPVSNGGTVNLNWFVVQFTYPFFDTLTHDQILSKYDELGDYTDTIVKGRVVRKYKMPYEEIYKYYEDYAEYMEKKEQILYNQIKYKTDEK